PTLDPGAIPRIEEVAVDGRVVLFTAVLALLTTLLFGLAPALRGGSRARATHLRSHGGSGAGPGSGRLRRSLVVAEAALAVVVVVAAGLVGRSLWELGRVDPGVRTDGLLTFELTLPDARYPADADAVAFYDELLDRIEGLPGVVAAAAATALPVADDPSRNDFLVEGAPTPDPGVPAYNAGVVIVRPGWFETMGIPVLKGRSLRPADGPDGPFVAVVNSATAERYWPGGDPLSLRVGYDFGGNQGRPWLSLVGVVGDTKVAGLEGGARPQIYLPLAQAAAAWGGAPRSMRIAARTELDPRGLAPAVRATVHEMDPTLAVAGLRTMEDVLSAAVAGPRFAATLLSSFGLIALLLAVLGIYGVVSYNVSKRTREIGLRMALGADRGAVSRMVVREGATPAILGLGLGLAGAALASRLLPPGLLFEVSPTDPGVLAAIAVLL
ncbi:MAG TPA: FtsX-like permease family protein, partial [Longimicrobiales bacterium]|nr:FtsX-like permease family protein [Longimicrobiales bacterium]